MSQNHTKNGFDNGYNNRQLINSLVYFTMYARNWSYLKMFQLPPSSVYLVLQLPRELWALRLCDRLLKHSYVTSSDGVTQIWNKSGGKRLQLFLVMAVKRCWISIALIAAGAAAAAVVVDHFWQTRKSERCWTWQDYTFFGSECREVFVIVGLEAAGSMVQIVVAEAAAVAAVAAVAAQAAVLVVVRSSHSAQSADERLHLNTHAALTKRSQSGLSMPLFRHSVGAYQETSSHATCQK